MPSTTQTPVTAPPLPAGYTLQSGYPNVSEYCRLRSASGLSPKSEEQAAPVPAGSWYGCFVSWTDPSASDLKPLAVAMGRIIGDGGWYFHIADMATLPEHQRKGFGQAILKELLAYIKANAPVGAGSEPYVTLLADGPGRKLYERHGFVETAPVTAGMSLKKGWWAEL
ncbi:putative GNAT family N-acetyltransferase [Coniochaeta ligniaria NRRL 30616]|uniref:Putative GNAT family N-acetyltransferase n=1 Tax=Coniochaeta ligniaria NRRL 30616 TaxID=1408157 RepID=A0A1J7ITH1_9PEZI|nr:putative GNAT family N-acetyltransferase [Coniochaeta ligniaria NRRL 30616]